MTIRPWLFVALHALAALAATGTALLLIEVLT